MSADRPASPVAIPTPDLALAIVREHLGWDDACASRFTTGMAYYVYDVWNDTDNVVVRLGLPSQSVAMSDGLSLWQRLAPLGVPLPTILVDGTDAPFPFVIMSRLPGTDLGHVIGALPASRLTAIAQSVADAQLAAARLSPAPGFGFAAHPEAAPHKRWSDVIAASIERSRSRISANGLFPIEVVAPVLQRFQSHREALDSIAATPFLHDTTTKNVIVTVTGEFSGIVDVDDLCFGDPRYAAALTKAALLAFGGGPVSYIDPWLARMQLRQDSIFSFYTAEFLLNFMSEHGMTFNGNQSPSDPAMRARLASLLTWVLGEQQ